MLSGTKEALLESLASKRRCRAKLGRRVAYLARLQKVRREDGRRLTVVTSTLKNPLLYFASSIGIGYLLLVIRLRSASFVHKLETVDSLNSVYAPAVKNAAPARAQPSLQAVASNVATAGSRQVKTGPDRPDPST